MEHLLQSFNQRAEQTIIFNEWRAEERVQVVLRGDGTLESNDNGRVPKQSNQTQLKPAPCQPVNVDWTACHVTANAREQALRRDPIFSSGTRRQDHSGDDGLAAAEAAVAIADVCIYACTHVCMCMCVCECVYMWLMLKQLNGCMRIS